MSVHIMDGNAYEKDKLIWAGNNSDLITMQSPGNWEAVELIKYWRSLSVPVLLDFDDFSWDLSPFNPRYKDLGLKEVVAETVEGKKWAWKDGFNGFDLKSNVKRFEAFKEACKLASGITTTTEYLADKFRAFNPNVIILPNSIDFGRWKGYPRPDKYKDEIRIGWFGGDSHYKDLEIIHEQLLEVINRNKRAKLVLLTPDKWPQLFGKFPQDQVEYHPWAGLEIYNFILSGMFWDIGLAPIEVNEFGRCKSNIKWLEYSALGVPAVMTDSLPYNKEVLQGINGICAPNNGFREALESLINDESGRKAMGEAAYAHTKSHYDIDVVCHKFREAYQDTCKKESPTGVPEKPGQIKDMILSKV